MNTRFWTKGDLYREVDALRAKMGIPIYNRAINSKELVSQFVTSPTIEEIHFSDSTICGILYRGRKSTSIALNANRTPEMQNFDCMHELIHYFFHDMPYCKCICSEHESIGLVQNSFLEWQANEGSAEFLVPYKDFIPRFVQCLEVLNAGFHFSVQNALAKQYQVTPRVISIRMNSLAFEIDQFRQGVPIDKIPLLSKKGRERNGIQTTCYEAMCDFPMGWNDYIG